jgi:hypothetical protein
MLLKIVGIKIKSMTTLNFALCLIVCLVVIAFGHNYCMNYQKRMLCEKKEYEHRYLCIKDFIRTATVTAENYDIIERMFTRLNELPCRNKEKTSVLYVNEFLLKFEAEAKRRVR